MHQGIFLPLCASWHLLFTQHWRPIFDSSKVSEDETLGAGLQCQSLDCICQVRHVGLPSLLFDVLYSPNLEETRARIYQAAQSKKMVSSVT